MATLDHLHFVKAALRSPAAVGAIAPSSSVLARQMVAGLELPPGHMVVEFGPGTGPMTEQISKVLPSPDAYVGIERDPNFIKLLTQRFPKMRFVQGSAEKAPEYIAEMDHQQVGAIICGLPFASLPPSVQDGIVDAIRQMMTPASDGRPGTIFRTFQYVHAWPLPTAVRFRRMMHGLFGKGRVSRPVMRNLPPAFVLSWQV